MRKEERNICLFFCLLICFWLLFFQDRVSLCIALADHAGLELKEILPPLPPKRLKVCLTTVWSNPFFQLLYHAKFPTLQLQY